MGIRRRDQNHSPEKKEKDLIQDSEGNEEAYTQFLIPTKQ
jgi:hypothetical protein